MVRVVCFLGSNEQSTGAAPAPPVLPQWDGNYTDWQRAALAGVARIADLGESVSSEQPPALVHDYLLVMRGAERTFSAMAAVWPEAPLYTLLYDKEMVDSEFIGRVRTSYLQHLRMRQAGFRYLLPLYPHAIGRLPLQEHSLVISSSSAFAHGVKPGDGAVHICYCHSPFRYAWHETTTAVQELPPAFRRVGTRTLLRVREWDRKASDRVTHYIANSAITQRRIGDYYGRESSVVHPPVGVDRFRPGHAEDFLLLVGEVVRHKRTEVALEAVRRSGRKVKVVGTGPDFLRLKQSYSDCAEFLGRLPDSELAALYARALALIVPNVEEFGIAAVESQAAGRPVVAVSEGGALETIRDGETGVLVPPDDVASLTEVLRHTDFDRFDAVTVCKHAQQFSVACFQRRLWRTVEQLASRGTRPSCAAGG